MNKSKDKIIEELKKNNVPYSLLPEGHQKVLDDAGITNRLFWGNRLTWQPDDIEKCCPYIVYRLVASYGHTIECEVEDHGHAVEYKDPMSNMSMSLSFAVNRQNFIGYRYASGIVSDKPRRLVDGKMETPTHALFKGDI